MPPPNAYADLHTHTSYSDGRLSPGELVRRAIEKGISVLAVTDHDTVAGLSEAAAAAEHDDIRAVPGVELSGTEEGEEVHLLAYDIDPSHKELRRHLRAFRDARRERAWAMVDCLRTHGLTLRDDLLKEVFGPTHAVGRPHVAAALVRAGHVETRREAFERYLGRDGPGFVAKPSVPASEILDLVHAAGGLVSLAHPGHWMKSARLRRLVNAGLDGIEVVHPAHDASLRRYYQRLAEGYDLVPTGGSDYHGRAPDEDGRFGRLGLSRAQWERCRARFA